MDNTDLSISSLVSCHTICPKILRCNHQLYSTVSSAVISPRPEIQFVQEVKLFDKGSRKKVKNGPRKKLPMEISSRGGGKALMAWTLAQECDRSEAP